MARGQKATPRGDWSPERKETQNAWKREKRATISATVDKETAAAFRAICSARGLSVNAAVSMLIDMCISSGDLVISAATTTGGDDRRGDDQSKNRETTGAGSGDQGGPATISGDQTGDREGQNDTPGTVDLPTANDTPGTVD